MTNELQKQNTIESLIMANREKIIETVGSQIRADRFTNVCLLAMDKDSKLKACSPASFFRAMLTCAELDLDPNTPQGLAYLIPYYNNKTRQYECQFQVGYKGLMQLMYRSGMVASFNADVVYRQEVESGAFRYESGVRPSIEHRINLLKDDVRTGDPKDIVAAYAAVVLKTGEPIMRLVTRKDIDYARSLNQGNAPAWASHYAAMAIKTAIKRLASWMPQTERLAQAIEIDSQADRESAAVSSELAPAASIGQLNAAIASSAAAALPEPSPAPLKPSPAPAPAKTEEPPFDLQPPPSNKEKLLAALGEQCDGDEEDMTKLFNLINGGRSGHTLDEIDRFPDDLAGVLLERLEKHLQKLEGGAK